MDRAGESGVKRKGSQQQYLDGHRFSTSTAVQEIRWYCTFKQITHETDEQIQCQPALTTNSSKNDWAIGQLHDGVFIIRNRTYIPSDRGSYLDPVRWLRGLIHLQMVWIKKGDTEIDDEYPDDFRGEAPAMMSLCHEYLEVLPKLFSFEEERQSYVLNHSDLNLANILVDPENLGITGIVDLKMANFVPL